MRAQGSAEVEPEGGEAQPISRASYDSLTHGFHAYPARMHPAIARTLLGELSVGPGSRVLDPFCGSGTVAIEAMIAGWRAHGSDLDPLALRLARVKTERRGHKARARFRSSRSQTGRQQVREDACGRAQVRCCR